MLVYTFVLESFGDVRFGVRVHDRAFSFRKCHFAFQICDTKGLFSKLDSVFYVFKCCSDSFPPPTTDPASDSHIKADSHSDSHTDSQVDTESDTSSDTTSHTNN
jgi:hypothetical protein